MIDEKKLIEAIKLSNSYHASNSREQSLLDRVIRIVEEQPKVDWIQVKERLPEINTSVLVTWRKYITNQKFVDKLFLNDNSEWVCDLGKINGKAVAWMPLPEPYKGVMKDVE